MASKVISAANRVFVSGIQPTGIPHLGNYLGFIDNYVRIQEKFPTAKKFLFVADLHAISTGLQPREKRMVASLLACGVDPQTTSLFLQSQISEHCELMWILNCLQSVARLERLTQFKDKSQKYPNGGVPLGLLTYPVLQAADILLYKATDVPVGEDQTQHYNLVVQLAKKFNRIVGKDVFPAPSIMLSECPRIRSLRDPKNKMSKSDPSVSACIFINDSDEEIRSKIRKSMTDSFGTVSYDPVDRPGVSNLIQILSAMEKKTVYEMAEECKQLSIVELKDKAAESIIERFTNIRAEYFDIIETPNRMDQILIAGAAAARTVAQQTMVEVKGRIGFYSPRYR